MNFDLLHSPLIGSNLIEASAGTGKTYTIAGIFLRCLIQKRIPLSKILVVTFTDAATTELKERISNWILKARQVILSYNKKSTDSLHTICDIDFIIELVENELSAFTYDFDALDIERNKLLIHLNNAYTNFDNASIHTIHAFCRKSLTEDPIRTKVNPDIEIIADSSELIEEVILDYFRNYIYPLPEKILGYVTQKMSIDSFKDLLRALPIEDDFSIIPNDTCTIERIEANSLEILESLKSLRDFWISNRDGIIHFFTSSGNVNKATYNPKLISDLLVFLDSDSLPSKNLQAKFIYFHYDNVRLNKKGEITPIIEEFLHNFEKYTTLTQKQNDNYMKFLYKLQMDFIIFFREQSLERMQKRGQITYDQLIIQMNRLLKNRNNNHFLNAIQKKYNFALIDEFQDTDPIQYNIFKSIFITEKEKNKPIFLIGDPKQAIYKFRGADIFAYIKASKLVDNRYTLSTNFRSSKGVVEAVNFLFSMKNLPFIYDELNYSRCESNENVICEIIDSRSKYLPFSIDYYNASPNEIDKIQGKREIRQLLLNQCSQSIAKLLSDSSDGYVKLKENNINPSDIAILVRTNSDAIKISDLLKKANVPSVLLRSSSVYKTEEAENLYKLMISILRFGNHRYLFSALATSLLGYNAEKLSHLESSSSKLEQMYQRWVQYNHLWKTRGFITMFAEIDRNEGIRTRIMGYSNSMRILSNIAHLSELISKYETENSNNPEDVINWFFDKIYVSDSTEEEMMRLETDDESVRILTVHKSKGLEFPIVYCPFLLFDLNKFSDKSPFVFHDKDHAYKTTYVLDTSDDSQYHEKKKIIEETISEGLRLLYVAFTRAKYACHVSFALGKDMNKNALYYLLSRNSYEHNVAEKLTKSNFIEILENLQNEINNNGYSDYIGINRREILSGNIYNEDTELVKVVKPKSLNISSLKPSWTNTSYSGIAKISDLSHSSLELLSLFPTPDEPDFEETNEQDTQDIFGFPKGSNAGSCLHEMFEKIDYHNFENQSELICSILDSYSISIEWENVAIKMIADVLNKSIETEHESFKLIQTSHRNRINELEFFYDSKTIDLHKIADILSESSSVLLRDYSIVLNKNFELDKSIVHGFIDMFFEFGGKYYIVDWKSNYLGDSLDDYTFESMKNAMFEHHYILQFLIYIIAIDRYLKYKCEDYDYEIHFGGILYVFLRGVNMDDSTENGIFYFKPESALIDKLKKEMSH